MVWSVVQSGHASAAAITNSWTAAAGANFTAGNLIVMMTTWGSASPTDLTSFTIGAATGVIRNATVDAANTQSFAMGYFLNGPGGTGTIGINGTNVGLDSLILWAELTNTGVSGTTFDNSASRVSTTTTINTGTALGAVGELIVAFCMEDSVNQTLFNGSGYAIITNDSADPNFFGLSAMSEFQTAAAANDPSFTPFGAASFLVGGMAFAIPAADTLLAQACL